MKNKIRLSFDEYSVLRLIKKKHLVVFQDVVDFLCRDRDKTKIIIENLLKYNIIQIYNLDLTNEVRKTLTEEIDKTFKQKLNIT